MIPQIIRGGKVEEKIIVQTEEKVLSLIQNGGIFFKPKEEIKQILKSPPRLLSGCIL